MAQEETINSESDTLRLHSVSKATWRSTIVPSWGQAYNKKYWKMPIVYAAMGTTIFFAIDNHSSYRRYLDAFNTRIDDDPNTSDEFVGIYDERQLIEIQDQFRKWRDLNIILTGFAYALQIIDAHVDAHLFYYNVSDDLSFRWEPSLIQTPNTNAIGVSLKLDLK
jgi:hypothetical protein